MSGRGEGPGGDHVSSLRPGQVRAEKARLMKRFKSINLHRQALDVAITDNFPGEFDERSWQEAFDSEEPRDANRCVVVAGGYSAIVNSLAETIKSATGKRLLGLLDYKRPRAEDAFKAVQEDGGISAQQAEVLHRLYTFEGRLEHLSPDVNADEVFEAVQLLRDELPGLVKSIQAWLGRHGITFS